MTVDVQWRKILESLLPPTSDVVRQLGTSAHPRHYVQLLNSAYGLVENGEEVFARFLNKSEYRGESIRLSTEIAESSVHSREERWCETGERGPTLTEVIQAWLLGPQPGLTAGVQK